MGAKMKKSIFNGLRYFSNMFDPKEQEMKIGYPTDVKHVAHIGWDGPSMNSPSWMNEFRSAPLSATVTDDAAEIPKFPSSEFIIPEPKPLEKPSRRKKSSEKPTDGTAATESPKRDSSAAKHPRRRRPSTGGSGGESAEGSRGSRKELRERNGDGPALGDQEPPAIPKQSRRRRTKGSSSNSGGGESSRPRSRAHVNADLCIPERREELLKPAKMGEEIAA